jgi:Ca2+-binding EF-hand superfamily protein
MLKTRLEEIFEVLDSDVDGKISANKIDIKHLSTYALEIFAPLLCEMEEVSLELDKQTFIEAGKKLFQVTILWHHFNLILGIASNRQT